MRRATLSLTLAGLPGFVTLGCVSSSIGSDVSRVRELTRVERLAEVEDRDVDPESAADAVRLLAKPLDADTAVRVALLNNRELRATLREMGIARGQLIQAGLLPNPLIEAELLPERNTRVELRVEYDVMNAILAPLRARAASPELEAARYRAAAAVVDMGCRTRVAFYRLQAAQQRQALAQQVLDGYAAGSEAAQAMHAAGNVPELEAATQVAAYQKAIVRVGEIELEMISERESLERLLGLTGSETAWQVQAPLTPVPEQPSIPQNLETRALQASFELKETREQLEGLSRKVGLTRTEGWLPDVTVDVHGLQGDPSAAAGTPDSDWRLGAGVSLGVPLFDRNQGTTTALRAEFEALLERYYGLAVDLRSGARETRARLESTHKRAHQYQAVIVPAQRKVTEQTLLHYNAMQIGIFDLIRARREQLDVELAYVDTLREYWSSVAELDALLAGKHVSHDPGSPGAKPSAEESRGGH